MDFLLAFGVLVVMLFYFGIPLTLVAFWMIPLIAIAMVTAMGVGFWLSALHVQYRDVRHAVPFLTQFWLVATPIAYPSSIIPDPWHLVYALNPMVGVVEGFRWALLGVETAPGPMVGISALVAVGFLLSGAYYFRRMERAFADVV